MARKRPSNTRGFTVRVRGPTWRGAFQGRRRPPSAGFRSAPQSPFRQDFMGNSPKRRSATQCSSSLNNIQKNARAKTRQPSANIEYRFGAGMTTSARAVAHACAEPCRRKLHLRAVFPGHERHGAARHPSAPVLQRNSAATRSAYGPMALRGGDDVAECAGSRFLAGPGGCRVGVVVYRLLRKR